MKVSTSALRKAERARALGWCYTPHSTGPAKFIRQFKRPKVAKISPIFDLIELGKRGAS
jgi:hypothetical protein